MSSVTRRQGSRAIALSVVLAAAFGGSAVQAQDASEAPAAKVAVGGCLAGGADCLETATLITPDPTVTNATPQPWESVSVAADGTSLSVYFWMGVPECNGLQSVEVTPTESGIDLVLMTGVPAGAEDMVCIQIAQLYRTDVALEQPLIGGAFPE
jgi:hypothetical protein